MFAYRHLFHAGSFADVFKHALLSRVAVALNRKPGAWFYMDTHAGLGRYDLDHPWARKNAEFEQGIARIWQREDAPETMKPYLEIVRRLNPDGRLLQYPGSSEIVCRIRRPGDRMVLVEHNPDDRDQLAATLAGERGVSTLQGDGFEALNAFLPPKERRGFVLIDPSFDRPGEFKRLADAIALVRRRWATGTLLAWYPLMEPGAMRRFERTLAARETRKLLLVELTVKPPDWTESLRGCGMLLFNPPFGLQQDADIMLRWIGQVLAPGRSATRLQWLVAES